MTTFAELLDDIPAALQARFPEWERLVLDRGLDTGLRRCCTETLTFIGVQAMSESSPLYQRRGEKWVGVARESGVRAALVRTVSESMRYEALLPAADPTRAVRTLGNVTRVQILTGGIVAAVPPLSPHYTGSRPPGTPIPTSGPSTSVTPLGPGRSNVVAFPRARAAR